MLKTLEKVNKKQKELVIKIKSEYFNDFHSISRSNNYIQNYLALEIEKNLLIELLSKKK